MCFVPVPTAKVVFVALARAQRFASVVGGGGGGAKKKHQKSLKKPGVRSSGSEAALLARTVRGLLYK